MPGKQDHAEATARQHEAILNAIHTLERALLSAAPGRRRRGCGERRLRWPWSSMRCGSISSREGEQANPSH